MKNIYLVFNDNQCGEPTRILKYVFSKGKFKKYKSVRDFQNWTFFMSKNRKGEDFGEKHLQNSPFRALWS